ncbi:MAG TPA: GGDEF domain-containing protein [Mycobacteriales bacterium]|nr:GGDEF domain-containing protein [Mycobacteriales bacterium]
MTAAPARRGDLVPLADRLLYLRVLRAVLTGLTVADAALLPHLLSRPFESIASAALSYFFACALIEMLWRMQRSRAPLFFIGLLLLDGLFLGYACGVAGGSSGPQRYLVLVYIASVTLLTSSRTGVVVALWQTLVQILVAAAQAAGIVGGPTSDIWSRLVALVLAMWVLATLTTLLAAVNEGELRRRRFELEQLASMGRALEDAHAPAAVGAVLLGALSDTFRFRRLALFAVDGDRFSLLAVRGLRDARVADLAVSTPSVMRAVLRDRRTALVHNLDDAHDQWLAGLLPDGRNLAVFPLLADGEVGVLVAETGRRRIGLAERRMVVTADRFVSHGALALRNANLLAQMQQMAITDGLTQLANRREFDRRLDAELARAARDDGRLSIVLLDIDFFKQLNDTHGHVVGDSVLRQVAQALRDSAREYDTVARFGGEEFVAVLPGCSAGLAAQVAERLRAAVETAATDVPVTVSAGVSTYPYNGTDAVHLLSAADGALYASKRAGRNRVSTASPIAARTGIEAG